MNAEICLHFSEMLKTNDTLEQLNMECLFKIQIENLGNSIKDEGCKYLKESLIENKTLKRLYLMGKKPNF
jgi:hypothetical protein